MQGMGDGAALSGERGTRDSMCRAHDSLCRAHDPSGVRDEDGCRLGRCEPLWAAS